MRGEARNGGGGGEDQNKAKRANDASSLNKRFPWIFF